MGAEEEEASLSAPSIVKRSEIEADWRRGTHKHFALTGILSHLGAKLRDWAVRQAGAGSYSWAALSSDDSKTRYTRLVLIN